jgi:hypothetical protein
MCHAGLIAIFAATKDVPALQHAVVGFAHHQFAASRTGLFWVC